MAGLDKIVDHIKNDANRSANEIIDSAKSEADRIVSAAKEEAKKQCEYLEAQSKSAVADTIKRGESAADLKEKRMILEAKQEIIDQVIADALVHLEGLPDNEYFDAILKMIGKYSLNKAGEIIFNEKDKNRLPGGFEGKIKDALNGKPGAELKISDKTRKISSGFVLVYGDIEENCSFDAIFSELHDTLQDKVGALLFE